MKTFSEYIEAHINEDILNEGFITNVAKWLGKTENKFTSIVNDLKNFGKKVKLAYGGLSANLLNKEDSLSEDERRRIINEINDRRPGKEQYEYIQKEWNNHNGEKEYKTSGFMTYVLVYGKELAVDEKDNNARTFFDQALKSISDETKNNAKEIRDNAKDDKAEDNNEQVTSTEEKPAENPNKEAEQQVRAATESDPIKSLSEKASIDTKKLEKALYEMMLNSEGDIKWDLNNANDTMLGLSAIICGGMLIKNEDVYNKILEACGIKFGKEFVEKISNKTE